MPTAVYAQLSIKREVDRPSTSVSEFVRYNNSPQLYSGKLSLSIPIYTLSDEDFTIPISLDYNYNGFIPNIPPSEFGVGWNLSCGGYITRGVKGIPDETISSINLQNNLNSTLWGFDFLPDTDKSGYQNLLIQCNLSTNNPSNRLKFNGKELQTSLTGVIISTMERGCMTLPPLDGQHQILSQRNINHTHRIATASTIR